MDTPVLIERLITNMERAENALNALLESMRTNRCAWIAIRPSALEASVGEMDAQARRAQALDEERIDILAGLSTALGMTPPVTITALCRELPTPQAQRLRRAGDSLDKAARAVKVETRVGERLLNTSRRIQDGLFQQAVREPDGDRARSYDRSAHASTQSPRAGSLVNGFI